MKRDQVFAEFKAYSQNRRRVLEKTTKEQLSTVARVLSLQSARYARTYGELPLPNVFELLKMTEISQKELELLRDGRHSSACSRR